MVSSLKNSNMGSLQRVILQLQAVSRPLAPDGDNGRDSSTCPVTRHGASPHPVVVLSARPSIVAKVKIV
ncbi:hypothetical protein TMatcc_005451 [Talaromyces marneffei ATCC 18224]